MTSISLSSYSSSSPPSLKEQMYIDFEQDYADVFPSPKHLEQFLQDFLLLLWKGILEKSNSKTDNEHRQIEIKKFRIIGGDEDSLDLQYVFVKNEGAEEEEEVKIVQVFLPEDPVAYFRGDSSPAAIVDNRPRRMNDGGEYVDDYDDEDDYY